MIEWTITINDKDGLQRFTQDFHSNLPTLMRKVTRGLATRMTNDMKKTLIQRGHTATNDLVKSIRMSKLGADSYGVIGYQRAIFLDRGTRPHGIPMSTKALVWCRLHGMNFGQLYGIIKSKGTKAHPFLNDVFMMTAMEFVNEMKRMDIFMKSKATFTGN